ncbi:RimK/LysX family protein [Arenimonas oryziterrae]|uniref:putative ATP-dependent zinc protease n=1 Tax=Arenimonas oryziterrae TaxID=498055 RepID=UPI0003B70185
MSRERIVLGWREWLSLPELGIVGIRAKIDTGARSSALHVEDQECFARDGVEFVRFSVDLDGSGARTHQAEARVSDRRMVTDSGGHRGERIFIRTRLRLDEHRHWPVEINLTQRRNMLFPMLLGRTALRGRCLVEPARSFLLGASSGPGPTS